MVNPRSSSTGPLGVQKALILAAGVGRRLRPLTDHQPKCMIEVGGVPLLRGLLENLLQAGVDEWVIVIGYRRDLVRQRVESWDLPARIEWVINDAYDRTNTLFSVAQASAELRREPFLLLNGDLWMKPGVVDALARDGGVAMLVDSGIELDQEAMKVILDDTGRIRRVSKELALHLSAGESIGAYRFDVPGGALFLDEVLARAAAGDTGSFYEAALDDLLDSGLRASLVEVPPLSWVEIDDHDDLARAVALAPRRRRQARVEMDASAGMEA